MIKLGNTTINKIFLGATEIGKKNLGNNTVFGNPIADPYGDELILYGDFSASTGWTLITGITIVSEQLNFNTTSNQYATRTIPSVGGMVRFTYEVVSYTRGAPRIYIFGGTNTGLKNLNTTVGTHELIYDCGSGNTIFTLYGGGWSSSASGGGEHIIDNISLKEVL